MRLRFFCWLTVSALVALPAAAAAGAGPANAHSVGETTAARPPQPPAGQRGPTRTVSAAGNWIAFSWTSLTVAECTASNVVLTIEEDGTVLLSETTSVNSGGSGGYLIRFNLIQTVLDKNGAPIMNLPAFVGPWMSWDRPNNPYPWNDSKGPYPALKLRFSDISQLTGTMECEV